MKNIKLASRYAKALYDFAIEKNQLEEVYQDVLLIMDVLGANRELELTIECPIVQQSKKSKIFIGVFENKVSEVAFGFLKLIVSKKREPALRLVCAEFIELYYKFHNIKIVQLVVAQETSEEIVEKIRKIVQEQTNSTIRIQTTITPGIIGGFIIKMEDFVFDASIIRHINDLKREFSHNVYQPGF